MNTQIETFDTNRCLDIDSHGYKGLIKDICREDYASRALSLWSPWQTPIGIDHAYANQFEEDMADIYNDTINLREEYKWLTCYIWLPEEYNVADIDLDTILLNSKVRVACLEIKDELQLLITRFPWSQVKKLLELGEIEFTISGKLLNGTVFVGSDLVTIIDEQ